MTDPADSFIPTKRVYPLITFFLFLSSFFCILLLIITVMGVCSKRVQNEDFFTFYNNLSKNLHKKKIPLGKSLSKLYESTVWLEIMPKLPVHSASLN